MPVLLNTCIFVIYTGGVPTRLVALTATASHSKPASAGASRLRVGAPPSAGAPARHAGDGHWQGGASLVSLAGATLKPLLSCVCVCVCVCSDTGSASGTACP